MTSLLGRAEDATVQEGFLCPICLQNCSSVLQLQSHVETTHDRRVIKTQVRQLFGRAKRLIKAGSENQSFGGVTDDHLDQPDGLSEDVYLGTDPFTWENNELGHDRSHWEYFLTQRSQRIDKVVVETNKILLRLDKLVNQGPAWSDQGKRRAFEKEVVPWEDDKSVKFCRYCMSKFSLGTRKHHCRLCGRILCNKCSYYMTQKYAECILSPAPTTATPSELDLTDADLAQALRVCKNCYSLTEKHMLKVKDDKSKPLLVEHYEKLNENMAKVQDRIPAYNDVVESLQAGGDSYSRDDAEAQRVELLQILDRIDILSKKILQLRPSDKSANSATTEMIHRRIRINVVRFLQEASLELKPLPSEEDLKRWKAERRAAKERQREEEKRANALREERSRNRGSPTKTASQTPTQQGQNSPRNARRFIQKVTGSPKIGRREKVGTGWTPDISNQASLAELTDDPLLQQISIISAYLNDAQANSKWDEVNALEANLKELQKEVKERERRKHEEVAGFYD